MAKIPDTAQTATLIREGFLALATEVGSLSYPMKIMDNSVNRYFKMCRLEEDLREAQAKLPETTVVAAADVQKALLSSI